MDTSYELSGMKATPAYLCCIFCSYFTHSSLFVVIQILETNTVCSDSLSNLLTRNQSVRNLATLSYTFKSLSVS